MPIQHYNQFEPVVEVFDAGTFEVDELVAGLGEITVAATGGQMWITERIK
ncbi:hypothetical protein MCEGEM3_02485 [Oxalobacteraceae bacterium]